MFFAAGGFTDITLDDAAVLAGDGGISLCGGAALACGIGGGVTGADACVTLAEGATVGADAWVGLVAGVTAGIVDVGAVRGTVAEGAAPEALIRFALLCEQPQLQVDT